MLWPVWPRPWLCILYAFIASPCTIGCGLIWLWVRYLYHGSRYPIALYINISESSYRTLGLKWTSRKLWHLISQPSKSSRRVLVSMSASRITWQTCSQTGETQSNGCMCYSLQGLDERVSRHNILEICHKSPYMHRRPPKDLTVPNTSVFKLGVHL